MASGSIPVWTISMMSVLVLSDNLVNCRLSLLSTWSCSSSYLLRMVSTPGYCLIVRQHQQPVFFNGIILSISLMVWYLLPPEYSLPQWYTCHSCQFGPPDLSVQLTMSSIDFSDCLAASQVENTSWSTHSCIIPPFSWSYVMLPCLGARAQCAFCFWVKNLSVFPEMEGPVENSRMALWGD